MDRIWSKLKGRKERSLSFEGKWVLIRAIAQAIPTYIMSWFLLPKGLCEKIERAVCSFWWGSTNSKRKIHWINKDKLLISKHEGDMGFKILRDFNIAMLAKQAWRFHIYLDTLVSRCFNAKYFLHSDVLQTSIGSSPSYAWRSIFNSLWVINKGSCWNIGDGNTIRIWEDNWIPQHNGFKPITTRRGISNVTKVKGLLHPDGAGWNHQLIDTIFFLIDSHQIK